MDYTAAATSVTSAIVGLSALGAAAFGVYLVIKGFSWGRRVTK